VDGGRKDALAAKNNPPLNHEGGRERLRLRVPVGEATLSGTARKGSGNGVL